MELKKPLKKMYVCCHEAQKDFFCNKVKQMLGEYVTPVRDYREAEAAYVIGEPTGQMQKEIKEIQERGIPVHQVNENLISQDIYETLIRHSTHDRQRMEERENGR
ncbi:MAG: hypothetical protein NC293_03055 [Roseburia sp.]|nr:hypothetical protein [Roseburia sp.]